MPPTDPTAILADGPLRSLHGSDDDLVRLALYAVILVLAVLLVRGRRWRA